MLIFLNDKFQAIKNYEVTRDRYCNLDFKKISERWIIESDLNTENPI